MRKLSNDELNRLTIEQYKDIEKYNFAIVLDNVRSMYNVGSVFRTADAFRCEKIFLCGITGKPPHKEIYKTALGATQSVQWEYFKKTEQAINLLKQKGYIITAIEQTEQSIELQDFTPLRNQKYAFVFGHEVKGVAQNIVDMCDMAIEIPQFGTKHSLNISVSAGIIIWDFITKTLFN